MGRTPTTRSRGQPAAGGGRWVTVSPERMPRWLTRFAERHGDVTAEPTDTGVRVVAPDGAVAECELPFGWPDGEKAVPPSDLSADDLIAHFIAVLEQPVRFGLILARRAALAVGVVAGTTLVASKVETSYVQGRTAAGGWSQQRFARRRDNQARDASRNAADVVARVLLPELPALTAVRLGGDKAAVTAILADRRLASVSARVRGRLLDVPEPRRAVLEHAVALAREVRIRVKDPWYDDMGSGHQAAR